MSLACSGLIFQVPPTVRQPVGDKLTACSSSSKYDFDLHKSRVLSVNHRAPVSFGLMRNCVWYPMLRPVDSRVRVNRAAQPINKSHSLMIAVQTRWGSLERIHQGSYRCSTGYSGGNPKPNLSKPSPLAVRFSFEPGFGGFGPNISNITMDKRMSMSFQGTHPPPLWAHPRRQQSGPSKDPTSQSTQ